MILLPGGLVLGALVVQYWFVYESFFLSNGVGYQQLELVPLITSNISLSTRSFKVLAFKKMAGWCIFK